MFDFKKRRLKYKYNLLREKRNKGSFCNAPFTALRFHRNGGVQVCCHHIDYHFLKGKTLHDIWFGKELTYMRKQMKKFDIPESCNFCSSAYYSENFLNVNALSFDYLEKDKSAYPVLMDFSLENTCNLSCIMCDASLSSSIQKEKNAYTSFDNFHYDNDFLLQLEEFLPYLKVAVFTGGEPFLIKTYYAIWEKMLEINPEIVINITTNGTIYNSKIEEVLSCGKFNITVSADSFVPENYNKIRRGADFFTTSENIEKFSTYCKKAETIFTITVCPMQINRFDIPDIVQKCNYQGWNFTYNTVLKPWTQALWSLKPTELESLIHFYKNFDFNIDSSQLVNDNIKSFNSLIQLLETWLVKIIKLKNKPVSKIGIDELRKVLSDMLVARLLKFELLIDISGVDGKVKKILDLVPDMLFSEALLGYFNNLNPEILLNEFEQNDIDTIADHICIIAFNVK